MSLNLLGLGMVTIGVGLVAVTIWFWNAARPDPEVLAPLEIMGDREFVNASENEKVQLLNAVRVNVSKSSRVNSVNK